MQINKQQSKKQKRKKTNEILEFENIDGLLLFKLLKHIFFFSFFLLFAFVFVFHVKYFILHLLRFRSFWSFFFFLTYIRFSIYENDICNVFRNLSKKKYSALLSKDTFKVFHFVFSFFFFGSIHRMCVVWRFFFSFHSYRTVQTFADIITVCCIESNNLHKSSSVLNRQ